MSAGKEQIMSSDPNQIRREALAQPEVAAEAAEQLLARVDPGSLPREAVAQPEVADEVTAELLDPSEDER